MNVSSSPPGSSPPASSPSASSPLAAAQAAIEVAGLTKSYGAQTAVGGVSFTVRPGSVTGFLGPNGAGKSTTLRMLTGLTRPTAGRATVLGRPFSQLANPGRSVGVLLDASAQHAGRTGWEVLKLGAMIMGLPDSRAGEMAARVGLTEAEAQRRTGTYSLGMRQRLGIAHALLGDPQVLILDEPANGLDPAGIAWMRHLLREFADRGGAVLLSSHLLREIEVVADQLVVIGRGRIVASGSKQELLAGSGTVVRGADDHLLAAALTAAGIGFRPVEGGGYATPASTDQVSRAAAQAGVVLAELRPGGGLEDLFLQLTANDAREEVTR
ncbi:MAG TPA: ATP-binding cassette domain-containing protein [Streptosporangiaceae bacterium]|jgi:ABC-2 type transport system ATP-binding protein